MFYGMTTDDIRQFESKILQ